MFFCVTNCTEYIKCLFLNCYLQLITTIVNINKIPAYKVTCTMNLESRAFEPNKSRDYEVFYLKSSKIWWLSKILSMKRSGSDNSSKITPDVDEKDGKMSKKSRNALIILFLSLVLDLLGFTVILPLMPSILEYYGRNDGQVNKLMSCGIKFILLTCRMGCMDAY